MLSAIRCSFLVVFVALCLTPVAVMGEAQTRRVPLGGDIHRPRVVFKMLPPYPDVAREKRIEGEVLMEIVVGTDGSVREAKVTKGAEASLDAAALGAVRQWRYEVTRVDGDAVEVVMPESLKFVLPKT